MCSLFQTEDLSQRLLVWVEAAGLCFHGCSGKGIKVPDGFSGGYSASQGSRKPPWGLMCIPREGSHCLTDQKKQKVKPESSKNTSLKDDSSCSRVKVVGL